MKAGEMMEKQLFQHEDKIPAMVTIREVANQTGLSYDYIRKICIQDKIVYVKAGAKRLVNLDILRRHLNRGEAAK